MQDRFILARRRRNAVERCFKVGQAIVNNLDAVNIRTESPCQNSKLFSRPCVRQFASVRDFHGPLVEVAQFGRHIPLHPRHQAVAFCIDVQQIPHRRIGQVISTERGQCGRHTGAGTVIIGHRGCNCRPDDHTDSETGIRYCQVDTRHNCLGGTANQRRSFRIGGDRDSRPHKDIGKGHCRFRRGDSRTDAAENSGGAGCGVDRTGQDAVCQRQGNRIVRDLMEPDGKTGIIARCRHRAFYIAVQQSQRLIFLGIPIFTLRIVVSDKAADIVRGGNVPVIGAAGQNDAALHIDVGADDAAGVVAGNLHRSEVGTTANGNRRTFIGRPPVRTAEDTAGVRGRLNLTVVGAPLDHERQHAISATENTADTVIRRTVGLCDSAVVRTVTDRQRRHDITVGCTRENTAESGQPAPRHRHACIVDTVLDCCTLAVRNISGNTGDTGIFAAIGHETVKFTVHGTVSDDGTAGNGIDKPACHTCRHLRALYMAVLDRTAV